MSEPAQARFYAPRIFTFFVDPLARIFLGVLLFVALLLGRPDLAIFCLVMLLLSTGAKLWRRLGAPLVECRFRSGSLRAQPGERISFEVEVENGSFLPMEVRARLGGAGKVAGQGDEGDVRSCKVGPHRRAHLWWTLKAPPRGVYPIGPPVTEVGDVLGLFFRRMEREGAAELVVYPRLFPVAPFPWQARELFGSLRAKGPIEDPIHLMGTREYQPGRPAKAIHWKASVRLNRLQEKVFEPSKRAKLFLSVDVRGFHAAGDADAFEETLEAAASVAVRLIREGVSVGMATNAGFTGDAMPLVGVALRPGHLPVLLERMARMTMEPAGDLTRAAGLLLDRTPGIGCIHFTYAADEEMQGVAAYFLGRRVPISFLAARPEKGSEPFTAAGGAVFPLHVLRVQDGGAP